METIVLNGWAASESAWELCRFPRARVFGYLEELDGLPERHILASDGCVLVGWSMGGSFALSMAARHPEKVKGLVLLAATPRMMRDDGWAGMSPRRLAALETGLTLTRGEGFFGLPEGWPCVYRMDTPENLHRGIEYLEKTDLRADLEKLAASGRFNADVAVFHSEKDGIVRPENAAYLKKIFPAARVEIVPGAEHALPVVIHEKIDAAVGNICYNIRL